MRALRRGLLLMLGPLLVAGAAPPARAAPPGRPELAPLTPSSSAPPGAEVTMLAAIGAWPPLEPAELRAKIDEASADRVGLLVIDTGLTELWRAYQRPQPYYAVVAASVAATRARRLAAAYYLPAFELRREPERGQRGSLLELAGGWAQHTLGGRPFLKREFEKDEFWNRPGDEALWVCPSSPWREAFFERVTRVLRAGAQTVFVDVPYFQRRGSEITCRCAHCQRRYRQATGAAIPSRVAPETQEYRRWQWWRAQELPAFFRALKERMRAVDPRARLVVEEYPSIVEDATAATGLDPALFGAEVDVFAHEYCARQFTRRAITRDDQLELATALAFYRGIDGERPTWVLSYGSRPHDSGVNAALHLAFDASFWETKGPEMNDTSVGRSWRRRLFGWFERHRSTFGRGRLRGDVGLYYSPTARAFGTGHLATLKQVARLLLEQRVPFVVVTERELAGNAGLRALILPSVTALGDSEGERLRRLKVPLLVVGAPPARGSLGLAPLQHRLAGKTLSPGELPARLGKRSLAVRGVDVLATLVERGGELQVRLVGLTPRRQQAHLELIPPAPVVSVELLELLGAPRRLTAAAGRDGVLRLEVPLAQLTVVRLQLARKK